MYFLKIFLGEDILYNSYIILKNLPNTLMLVIREMLP